MGTVQYAGGDKERMVGQLNRTWEYCWKSHVGQEKTDGIVSGLFKKYIDWTRKDWWERDVGQRED
jgi:hypothetical protein